MNNHTSNTNETPMKKCSKCGEYKPATLEYFNAGKGYKGGLRSRCKECRVEWHAQHYKNNKERIDEANAKYRKNNKERLAETSKEYRENNKERIAEYHSEYYKNNKDHIVEYCKNNKDHVAEIKKKYYEDNKDRHAEYYKEYRRANKDIVRVYNHNRRARKRSMPDTFTLEQHSAMLDYFDHSCAVCGIQFDLFTKMELDHWIPLADEENCPGTVATNMIPLCGNRAGFHGHTACNQSKSSKDPEQWIVEKYGNHKAKQILKRINDYFEWVKEQE